MTINSKAGWAYATEGRKAHWFNSNSPASACGKFVPSPASGRADDTGTKQRDNCAACDRYVEEAIRNAAPVETVDQLLRRAIGEHAVLKVAKELSLETDAKLREALGVGGRRDDPDGFGIAYVTKPKGTYKVTDERAYLAWVKANRPHAIVETVDPMFTKSLLLNEGATSDGEVADGIEHVVGNPALTVKPEHAAVEFARQLLAPSLPEVMDR